METKSFTDYMSKVIENLKKEERYGTAYIYSYAFKAFHAYKAKCDIPFSAFDKVEMKHFEQYLLDNKRSWNTISTYFRVLRAVYNRAVDEEIIKGECRLFHHVFTGVTSEKKRALEASEMRKLILGTGCRKMIVDAETRESMSKNRLSKELRRARDLLTLMLLLQGIGFSDLIHLRSVNLKKSGTGLYFLHFRRQKTGTELSIQVSPEAMAIIGRYRSKDSSSLYLLDLLDAQNKGEAMYYEYRRQLRNFNYHLSRLATFCHVQQSVSSYTARHTWATLAKFCEVPEEVISEGLGHSSLEVTRTYLKRFESEKLYKANKIIIDYVFSGDKRLWYS